MTSAGRAEPEAAVEEITVDNASRYLARRGLDAHDIRVEALGGGISNTVLRVSSHCDCFVLKQSLPRLRVEAVWEMDRRRILVERDCMAYLGRILPAGAVPNVRFSDDANFVFAMSCAPVGARSWKAALLSHDVDLGTARAAGALLAELQTRSASDPTVADRFSDRTAFFQGRIEPYHHTAAVANPPVRAAIEAETERMLTARRSLVLGDYSPKNTLVSGDGLLILDFEVAHFGDPAFDPAFCLSHLLLKAVLFWTDPAPYLAAARSFWHAYHSTLSGEAARAVEYGAARELACLLLARIDGKSRVEYLTDEHRRAFVRELAADALLEDVGNPLVVVAEAEQRLRAPVPPSVPE